MAKQRVVVKMSRLTKKDCARETGGMDKQTFGGCMFPKVLRASSTRSKAGTGLRPGHSQDGCVQLPIVQILARISQAGAGTVSGSARDLTDAGGGAAMVGTQWRGLSAFLSSGSCLLVPN